MERCSSLTETTEKVVDSNVCVNRFKSEEIGIRKGRIRFFHCADGFLKLRRQRSAPRLAPKISTRRKLRHGGPTFDSVQGGGQSCTKWERGRKVGREGGAVRTMFPPEPNVTKSS